ncbi:unnamed protein product [Parnassius apollo]|uniref:(apollo) hypothetical protein n=1 Tax=Parnassius apollo TaxID=110799 RepID=A0A8S3WZN8_PARAO|nr:unnamed protein product [Parnassius apollo]
MLRVDAEQHQQEYFFDKIRTINLEVILDIQKDIDPHDMISLVFLLYKVPDTALQRLIVFQRVSKDVSYNNINLLYDWALNVQTSPTWRYEFLEALTICRLYHVIRKLGFSISHVKDRYLPGNLNVSIYVNPIKKALYKLCENINANNLLRLKKTLLTYDIDTSEYEACELIILQLMCQKFITLSESKIEKTLSNNKCEVEKLIMIVENISELKKIALELREIQNKINNESSLPAPHINGTPVMSTSAADPKTKLVDKIEESFIDLCHLHAEDISGVTLKSDTKLAKDAYPIKNTNRIGICCIINQEEFYPSKESIEGNIQTYALENRLGSTKDQLALEHTMSSLNFKIRSCCNVNHKDMFKFIKCVILNDVCPEDSIFVLCILSHGIRGHVYAADSVKVKVEDIQNLLDSDEASNLHGIPKVLILQACQVDEQNAHSRLVADGPLPNYFLRKSDFLIYWATAPEYEAYRDEQKGSIFIQTLCSMIAKKARHEHLYDIFTKVTDLVSGICSKLKCAQVPIFESTLRKKLYMQIPQL